MTALNETQLATLRSDLAKLAAIKYVDVRDELLDHYASLTERYVADGHNFEWASTLAWRQMGEGAGVQQVQDEWLEALTKQIKQRHRQILKSYFCWPALVSTALMGGLCYVLAGLLPSRYVVLFAAAIAVLPSGLVWLHFWWTQRRKPPTSQAFVVGKFFNIGTGYLLNTVNVGVNVLPFLFVDSEREPLRQLIEAHAGLAGLVCAAMLIAVFSLGQLYHEQFQRLKLT